MGPKTGTPAQQKRRLNRNNSPGDGVTSSDAENLRRRRQQRRWKQRRSSDLRPLERGDDLRLTGESLLRRTVWSAAIAGSAVDQEERVVGYVSLGYPFGLTASILFGRHNKAILQSSKPKLFVMGTRDGFTSVKQLENKLKSAAGRVETHLLEGVSHFQMEGPDFDSQMADLIDGFIATL
ncbi:hypothetical protein EJ110_NYTH23545 [Nymphaea thermarum]|nr:hypothetical protein EJ110_NYTH23545 [Nymphaea thermarum]